MSMLINEPSGSQSQVEGTHEQPGTRSGPPAEAVQSSGRPTATANSAGPAPTPRTDAEYDLSAKHTASETYTSEGRAKHSANGWNFARQLERELAAGSAPAPRTSAFPVRSNSWEQYSLLRISHDNLERESAALRHDIERAVAANTELATENEELRRQVGEAQARNNTMMQRLAPSIEYVEGTPVGYGEDAIDRLDAALAEERAKREALQADADVMACVIRTGYTASPTRQWTDEQYRKTCLRAQELHAALASKQGKAP